MKGPVKVDAQPLTPEEEARLRATPLRTVRAREVKPSPSPADAQRARWRGVAIGATVAVSAGLAATLGYLLIRGKRNPRLRRKHA